MIPRLTPRRAAPRLRRAATTVAAVAALVLLSAPAVATGATTPPDAADAVPGLSTRLEALAGLPAASDLATIGAELGLAPEGPGSLQLDGGAVAVSVRYSDRPDDSDFAALAELGTVLATSSSLARATAYVDPSRLAEVAALPGVATVTEALRPALGEDAAHGGSAPVAMPATAAAASCRSIEAVAPEPLRADLATALLGADGAGVTVGIVSDSFARSVTAASTVDEDVAAGLLPGPGNPCGREHPVSVLDDSFPDGAIDEGRAMAQVVHSIAPGATLMFSALGVDDLTFHDAVLELAAAGADVIVDDAYLYDQPFYQENAIGLAVEQVVAQGVTYLTSAGNYTNIGKEGYPSAGYSLNGWQTDRYRPTACPAAVLEKLGPGDFDCMDFAQPGVFAPSGAADATSTLELPALAAARTYALQWAEPWGASTARLHLAVTDPEGDTSVFDPNEPGLPTVSGTFRPVDDGAYSFSIVRDRSAPGGALEPAITWVWSFRGEIAAAEYYGVHGHDRVGATVTGHGGLPAALSVAALPAEAPTVAETFSSIGPVTRLFATEIRPDGPPVVTPLDEPVVVAKPDVAGVDRVLTSFFSPSRPVEGRPGVHSFWGTSASAPSAAAVVALGLQHSPGATPAEVKAALTGTAVPASSGSVHIDDREMTGAGRIDALAFLEALPTPAPPPPTPVPSPQPVPAPGPVPVAPTSDPAAGGRLAATGAPAWAAVTLALAAAVAITAGVVAGARPRSRSRA